MKGVFVGFITNLTFSPIFIHLPPMLPGISITKPYPCIYRINPSTGLLSAVGVRSRQSYVVVIVPGYACMMFPGPRLSNFVCLYSLNSAFDLSYGQSMIIIVSVLEGRCLSQSVYSVVVWNTNM